MSVTGSVPTQAPEVTAPSTAQLIARARPAADVFVPDVDADTLAGWMGIERDAVLELAHSGSLPCRVGAKGVTFDVTEIQRALTGGREGPGFLLQGEQMKEITSSLSSATDANDAWRVAASHLMAISGARVAALFVTDPDAWLRALEWIGAEVGHRRAALESVAAWVAIARTPVSVGAPADPVQPADDFPGHVAGIPVRVADRLAGVVALDACGHGHGMGPDRMAAAEAVVDQLALVLHRFEVREALAQQKSATELNQQQMEAFALDIRNTYAAEKQRAEQLAEALDELEKTYLATVKGLAVAVEAKDEYTAGHLQRVTLYGMAMMRIVAPEEALDPQYEYGFLLHDVGKMAIPDSVLKKAGPLTDEEWVVMRSHSEMGRRILQDIPFLAGARQIVYAHHERWDGEGYPRKLKGDEIPLGARVFSIADSFDAMRSDRPYRKALPIEVALSEISKGSGTQFWPPAAEAFLQIPVAELDAVASQVFPHLGTEG